MKTPLLNFVFKRHSFNETLKCGAFCTISIPDLIFPINNDEILQVLKEVIDLQGTEVLLVGGLSLHT